jgi:hypothetical protein
MPRSDIIIAIVGGIIWGAMTGWNLATLGEPDPILTGVLNGVVWAAAWLVIAYTRDAYLRSRKKKEL